MLCALACAAGVAHAQDKPWAAGVSAENQAKALDIYKRANSAFEQAQYKDALAEYEQALVLWDHPAIRYNAAVCLINLDRPVEAYEHLLAALRFGEPPLGRELHSQGVSYRKLLEKQVAELEVACEEPDAKVSLDGKQLFVAPSKAKKFVTTGQEHQLVAEKQGYQTKTETIRLAPGKHTLVLVMEKLEAPGRYERRWNKWTPRAIAIAGGVIAAFGGLMYWQSSSHYADFDALVERDCPIDPMNPMACTEDMLKPDTKSARSSAQREAIFAYSGLAVGGAALAVGVTMVFLNQPRLVTPVAGGDRVGLVLTTRW